MRPRYLNLRTGGNMPRRDVTLPLVAIVTAMVAVTVMIWGVVA